MDEKQPQQSPTLLQMQATKQKIVYALQYLDRLNNNYKQKQQKTFLNTFLHVMDKMSNELMAAHEHIQNIDKEIAADSKCVLLAKELEFFKEEAVYLHKELEGVRGELGRERRVGERLMKQGKIKTNSLLDKIKTIQKYKSISANNSITHSYTKDQPNSSRTNNQSTGRKTAIDKTISSHPTTTNRTTKRTTNRTTITTTNRVDQGQGSKINSITITNKTNLFELDSKEMLAPQMGVSMERRKMGNTWRAGR